jgi:hypothetical protein
MTDASDPYAAVMAQAMSDPAFRMRLMADPVATMAAAGIAFPEGVAVKVVENTETLVHLVLPAVGVQELTDQELEAIAAGGRNGPTYTCIGCGNVRN